jgi:hypothetical protein
VTSVAAKKKGRASAEHHNKKSRDKKPKCKRKPKPFVCHFGQTIQISACALKGHLKHGDHIVTYGVPCP